MALDNAQQRLEYTLEQTTVLTTSELGSESSDSSEFFSDSGWNISEFKDIEYKYSPLKCDSDMDNDVDNAADESIALLANEMLCCEHESDTDTDMDSDNDDDDVDDNDASTETEHNYELLMCSEDDEDIEQQQFDIKPIGSLLLISTEFSTSESSEFEPNKLQL